jgi:L-rhamnose-H+ transport protein
MVSWLGIVVAGVLNGSFAVPMKTMRVWKFEHVWGVFSVLAMFVIPWCAVLFAVPHWYSILAAISGSGLAGLIVLGLIWGVGSLFYGLAIDLLGIALGFSIQLGLSIVIGALIPFALVRGLPARSPSDWAFLGGVVLMVIGVIVCATAGKVSKKKETSTTAAAVMTAAVDRVRFRKGIVIAVLGGMGSPLLNFGIQYGTSLLPRSAAGTVFGQWIAWAVFLSAASVSQAAWCFYRVAATRQTALFRTKGARHDIFLALVMGVVWAVSIFLYGASATSLGSIGTSVGWPVFIGLIVIASNTWGVALGEWKLRPKRDLYQMIDGSVVLIVAAFVIGWARARW